jgi:hypothetical protein
MKRLLVSSISFILGCFLLLCAFNSCNPEDKPSGPETPTGQFKIEAVDLGLSVKWANANLGAKSESDPGDYYAWGETKADKENYSQDTYKFYDKTTKQYTKYVNEVFYGQASEGIPDNKAILDPEDDAAHVLLGSSWRMPTKEERDELLATVSNPNYTWEKGEHRINNESAYGLKITYKKTNTSIILIDGGHMKEYYQNTCHKNGNFQIWTSSFVVGKGKGSDAAAKITGDLAGNEEARWHGLNIRPVCP